MDDKAVDKIKGWVENGGTLIAVGGSAAFAAEKNGELSSIRLRRDVLDKPSVPSLQHLSFPAKNREKEGGWQGASSREWRV